MHPTNPKESAKALYTAERQRELNEDKRRRDREYQRRLTDLQTLYLSYAAYRAYQYTVTEAKLFQRVADAFRGRPGAADSAHSAAALARAQQQLENAPALPEDIRACLLHPGVNPTGKFSELDMEFADRFAKVGAAAATGTAAQKAWFSQLEATLQDKNSALYRMNEEMQAVAKQQREYSRAAKLCKSAKGSRMLLEECHSLEDCDAVRNYDGFLCGLEHAFSLRKGSSIPADLQPIYHRASIVIPEELLQPQPAAAKERSIEINFQDFSPIFHALYFASPKGWELPDLNERLQKAPPPNAETCVKSLRIYLQATAQRTMDILFGEAETLPEGISRADLVTIDGQTLRERLMQDTEVQAAMKKQGTTRLTSEIIRQKGAEMVAIALLSQRPVEAWVPRVSNGKITLDWEPTELKHGGSWVSTRAPSLREAWGQLCRSAGLDGKKETDPEAQRARQAESRERARNAVQLYYPHVQLELPPYDHAPEVRLADAARRRRLEKEAPAYVRRVTAKAEAYSYMEQLRMAFFNNDEPEPGASAHCLARLALTARGSDLSTAQLLDMNNLVDQKQAIGREYLRYVENRSLPWYNETMRNGAGALVRRIEQDLRRMDMQDPEKALEGIPQLGVLVMAATRLGQEMRRPENWEYQQRLGGPEQCELLQSRIRQAGALFAAGQALLQEENQRYETWQNGRDYDDQKIDGLRENFRALCTAMEQTRRSGRPMLDTPPIQPRPQRPQPSEPRQPTANPAEPKEKPTRRMFRH